MIKSKKNNSKKQVLLQIIGIFIGRATIGNFSPIAVSYFGALHVDKNIKLITMAFTLLGMNTVLPTVDVIKYFAIMITTSIIVDLFKKNHRITIMQTAIIIGFITSLISFANNIFSPNIKYAIILALTEGIAVFSFTIVLRKGIEGILYIKKGKVFNTEEIISVAIIVATIIYGLPSFTRVSNSMQVFACLFSVLFVGYKYGPGNGAIMGLACGLVMSLFTGNLNQVGIFCLLGLLVGTIRGLERISVTIGFIVAAIVITGMMEGIGSNLELIQAGAIPTGMSSSNILFKGILTKRFLPLISSSALFYFLPDSIAYKTYDNEIVNEKSFTNKNIQLITKDKLKEFSRSFYNLSGVFNRISSKKIELSSIDKEKIFNELSEGLCKGCPNCNLCWENHSQETFQGISNIIEIVEDSGIITRDQISESLLDRCIKIDDFIIETIRIFELAKINISYNNKIIEIRKAIAEQFSQIGYALEDFSSSLYKTIPSTKELEKDIVNVLRANHVFVDNISIFEKHDQRKEIFVYAHTQGRHCITTKGLALIISDIVDKVMIPSERNKLVITKVPDLYIFEEDTNYKIITGVSKMTKDGSLVSGDNHSFIRPDSGTAVMTLSDGMGTGEVAFKESEIVINLLEEFMEAGFNMESAIKLINSVMLVKSDYQIYSTVDMSTINLYTGICNFIKLGASTTFIKNDSSVDILQSSSLPIGILNKVDYEVCSKKLKNGDFLIMVTDGIIDNIPGEQKEEVMAEFIKEINMNNPKEIANAVLNYSLELNSWAPKDDMTVLVGGFWNKH